MADRDINNLIPEMRAKVARWESLMKFNDIDYLITCTRRTQEEQNKLYAQGRTVPGNKVTWTLNSKHIPGKAFDFVIMNNGKPDWGMVLKDSWNKAVQIGKGLGLKQVVGKDGRVKEYAHFEID